MQNFSARETEWLLELDGIELASFRQRALAFLIDSAISGTISALVVGVAAMSFHAALAGLGHSFSGVEHKGDSEHGFGHLIKETVIPVLYFGLLTWRGHGQSPGKRVMKIRVVSLVHRHLSLWHSVERALGYAAAFLEAGFGFFQFFIHPYRRCVQDRIAETIVVTERSYKAMQFKPAHPLLPDDGHQPTERASDDFLPGLAPPPPPRRADGIELTTS